MPRFYPHFPSSCLIATVMALLFTAVSAGLAPCFAAVEIRERTSGAAETIVLEIEGTIAQGDAQRVQSALAALPTSRQIVVRLNSPGGVLQEALRMGRYFSSNGIRTEVLGSSSVCLSACALAFLGGRNKDGESWRVKGSAARIGYHAFRRVVTDKEFTVADMEEAVASTQRSLLAVADYLIAVNADIEFLSMMLEKPSNDMSYLENAKALRTGVHVLDETKGQLVRATPVGP